MFLNFTPKNNRQELQLLKSAIEKHDLSVDLSKYDENFIVKSVQHRMQETFCKAFDQYFMLIAKSLAETNRFIDSLQISYSEFFRNPLTYSVLEKIVLPMLIQKHNDSKTSEVRIWSSACANGQEPYSLAILMEEIISHRQEKSKYRIFATDQSQLQVNAAQKGKYSTEDLNNLTLKRISSFFDRQGNNYQVKPELKKNMEFSVFDLFDEQYSSPPASIFGGFDLVLCANLLFYYKSAERKKIIEKVDNSMADSGFLITGETEREILIRYGYKEVYVHSGIFVKR
ncbi:MAG: CheR family methyltransferase [Bacteroidales bacterium]